MNAPEPMLRQVPSALDSEAAVVGALLLDNGAFDRISDRLKPEHFYNYDHRLVFAEISRELAAGHACDVLTVADALTGQVEITAINAMAQFVPSTANLARHAEIVIERYRSRALATAADEIATLAFDKDRAIDDRIEAAQAQLTKLAQDAPRDEWIGAYEGMVKHTQVLEDRADGKITSWPTGLVDLDDFLEGGLRPGGLYIVGARPSMGKTALAMTIGLNMAPDFGVGMLSMEMPHTELRDRMTAMLGRVSLSKVIRPKREDDDTWHRVMEGVEAAQSLNFRVSDQGGLNINQVRSKARNLKRAQGLDVLIVDYLGLMSGLDPRQSRAYQLEEVTRGLKTLAKELSIAVLCLAQVNRRVEERVNSTPALSDLRDSGAIEQDADVVVFVHRPIQAKPDIGADWEHYAKLAVAKNRQGRCGYVNLFYQSNQTRFDSWAGPAPYSAAPKRAARGFEAEAFA